MKASPYQWAENLLAGTDPLGKVESIRVKDGGDPLRSSLSDRPGNCAGRILVHVSQGRGVGPILLDQHVVGFVPLCSSEGGGWDSCPSGGLPQAKWLLPASL